MESIQPQRPQALTQSKQFDWGQNNAEKDQLGLVSCTNLTKRYVQGTVEVLALNDVSLNIEGGEFVALCGPSGSGKTTLLNLIGGLDRPSDGTIRLSGISLNELSEAQLSDLRLHKIGFVFQSYNLIPVLTAQENVEFVMQLQGISSRERKRRSREVLEKVGLGTMMNRRPSALSGGQQQRVAVARAIAAQPSIILADEPTANLDSKTATSLLDLMLSMNQEEKVTFIFSTHDPLVMERAKRIIRLTDGRIESDGSI